MVRIIPLFILVNFLLVGGVSPLLGQQPDDQVVVLEGGNRIMVRSAPEIREGTAIGAFPAGTVFPYVAEAAGWYQIVLPSGDAAWVSARFSRLQSAGPASVTEGESQPSAAEGELPGGGSAPVEPAETGQPSETGQPTETGQPEPAEAGAESETSGIGPGKAEEAVQAYRYALEVNPDDGLAHFELAVQLEVLGRLEEALFHFRRAAELGERETEALQRAADVAERIPSGALQSVPEVPEGGLQEVPAAGEVTLQEESAGTTALIVTASALGTALVLGLGLFFYFRSRRVREVDRLLRLGQGREEAGAMPGSAFLKELKLVQGRREAAGSSLDRRFQELKNVLASTSDPAAEGESDSQLRKIGELTRFLEEQQSRINALSDLLSLQNDKIAAQEEEIELLRKLLPPR